ncbi:exonuclease subunit SbcD [Ferrimonas marina]|uniref:Nuclease SbcCD subunit D n=1 Tax=Ferrimonas marina TaxID=299255 RepID=A0A1M5YC28_9GAMM|nr:exonuclease subunit SbcD [Ferrimonas marina]SHI09630.1 Exodeoxyribonuclease I subunit D [Ferrimonas marina]
MHILHTSDWHLGQVFYGKSRAAEHRAFLDWLLQQVDQHQVDALIVAGDLFDTGTPPSYARAIYNEFVVALASRTCQLVLLGGNHDSVAMLNESKPLLNKLGATLVAGAREDLTEQVMWVRNTEGDPIGQICAVPYLRPRDIQRSEAEQSGEQKQRSLQQAIAEHYQGVIELARSQQREQGLTLPLVATGHLTTVGASSSESVRDLYIGTLDAFPAAAFPEVDYLALGHIHRSQTVAGQDHLRYCGSPIALSFDELGKAKEVLLVELGAGQPAQVTALKVPSFQPMAMLKGDLAAVERQLSELESDSDQGPVWLDIEVVSDDYLSDLQARVMALVEGLEVEVLLVRRARADRSATLQAEVENETLAELSVQQVFERRLALETLSEAQQQRLQQRFDQVAEILAEEQSE